MHYKPTDSHSYLLYSSSHPSHVKNSIPYSQFLRLRRLCSEDSDFSLKSEEMCEFFDKRGYPASVVEASHHRAQQIDRQSALQTSQKENSNRIPFTLTFHPHNHAVKSIILKNFKLLQNDPDTGRIFSQPPLISFKRDKNIGHFLVRSAFQTSEQPGTFKCARARCKTCPFIFISHLQIWRQTAKSKNFGQIRHVHAHVWSSRGKAADTHCTVSRKTIIRIDNY